MHPLSSEIPRPPHHPRKTADALHLPFPAPRYPGYNPRMSEERNTIPAGKFKARCLGLLDHVAKSGETVVITKRGRPVARLVPIDASTPASLLGSVQVHGDIVAPTGESLESDC
jgi:prevent-host-death family protein